MGRPVRHWPGGIPRFIRPHPESDLSLDQIKEEVKGWLLFVQESWVSRANAAVAVPDDDDEYELRQRRTLIKQWASATQDFRDSFHDRAPIGLPGTEGKQSYSEPDEGLRYPAEALERILDTRQPCDDTGVISLVPVDAMNPINQARWVKFVILLYRYDMEVGHCLESTYMPSKTVVNPATTGSTLSIEDFPAWLNLEAALFGSIYLTRTGTVLYLGNPGPYALVDEDGLETGRLALTMFKDNGAVEGSVLIRPFNMKEPHMWYSTLGKALDEVKHSMGGYRHQNPPLDMDLPILDILCNTQAANQLVNDMVLCDRDQWKDDVELYAPGYLALEAAGRGGEYDFNLLASPDVIGRYTKPRVLEKLRSGADPRFTFLPQ
ncbi:hypothetical protein CFD26_101647 [Aspergillus turcosus]|uniref:Uncharacterized protein n=1 Tax=Aspergillus turcosus TaxID=1245748 RepID=A0A421D7D6_9EURO|nr:hypothetical protein CFD26_101647 [Aspergillus turcosus]